MKPQYEIIDCYTLKVIEYLYMLIDKVKLNKKFQYNCYYKK